ncbi:uncharacterized protein C8Q71DRAFT_767629 [Rhodofomes roseus]|uniref:Uncharacterized protein n=1 Tax=Rhodofomes roseus TaxID=34475 RepID=A0ABQ8KBK4_9APHY|nr:uncharacterized protein C8Q71DRAFT_767629 [Rhodofomes roseus]KAH9834938.1 hypothetical protein C8Q71DRAFT_767629 [Rhodofomes roseus]
MRSPSPSGAQCRVGRASRATTRPLPRSVAVQATRVARPVHVLNEQRLTAQWGERLPGPRPSKLSPSEGSSESAETPQGDLDVALELVYALLLLNLVARSESSTARRALDQRGVGDVLQVSQQKRTNVLITGIACPDPEGFMSTHGNPKSAHAR